LPIEGSPASLTASGNDQHLEADLPRSGTGRGQRGIQESGLLCYALQNMDRALGELTVAYLLAVLVQLTCGSRRGMTS